MNATSKELNQTRDSQLFKEFFLENPEDYADAYKMYRADINIESLGDKLTADEEKALARKIRKGDAEALNKLVSHNVLYVNHIARRYVGNGLDFMDLVQEGNIGLMIAARKYNEKKGFRFTTYATYWINQAISRAICDKGKLIRQPVYVREAAMRVQKAIRIYELENGRTPSTKELTKITGFPAKKVEFIKALANQEPSSLDILIGEDMDTSIGELVPDEREESDLFGTYALKDRTQNIQKILDETLTEREQYVLKRRLGFFGEPKTLVEVGDEIGVSRERIRQIETRAMRKLRHPRVKKLLKEYI